MTVGIDDIAIHLPKLFVDMQDFAVLREQDYEKLKHGLGLYAMAIPDAHEDVATMGANAVARLLDRNQLDPRRIGRIYLGTESALDGAKPTATYVLDMLRHRYADQFGDDCLDHCDVVDMTFACIGAVDALHNTLDWVAQGGEAKGRIGIVVFSDNAKYELQSTGEYTQGAGGGALLVRHNPRLLAIEDRWGISTRPAHDFFKPRRSLPVEQVVEQVLHLVRDAGGELPDEVIRTTLSAAQSGAAPLFGSEPTLQLHKDTPVFDGPFSNRCYREAVKEAFIHFRDQAIQDGRYDPERDPRLTEQWKRILLHLPYAFQGKRMFPDVFRYDRQDTPMWGQVEAEAGPAPAPDHGSTAGDQEAADEAYRRRISKTQAYKAFVKKRIERGQRASSLIGNQYTGSIFLALMSTLESDLEEGNELSGSRMGLCGYGSGAKAKVFEGVVQPGWRDVTGQFKLFERLANRQRIPVDVYEALHRCVRTESVVPPTQEFVLTKIERGGVQEGLRRYQWVA